MNLNLLEGIDVLIQILNSEEIHTVFATGEAHFIHGAMLEIREELSRAGRFFFFFSFSFSAM